MSTPTDLAGALNPDVYLNHLSPAGAIEFEVCRNITLIVFGATIWDILIYAQDDIRIVKSSRPTFVIFCFVFSRIFTASYVICSVVRRTMPINDPHTLAMITGSFCILAVGCSSYLLLRRINAVYADSQGVRWFFSVFWFAFVISEISVPLSMKPVFIPGTQYYKDAGIRSHVALSLLMTFLFDSSVFLAISYKIASMHNFADERVRWNTLVSGKALPRLSRAVLQGGQQYYLTTVGFSILVGIVVYLPSVHQTYKAMCAMLLVPLMTSMACRVFRNIKLFDSTTDQTSPISNVQFA